MPQLTIEDEVVAEALDDGLVVLDAREGVYYTVNRTGAGVWHGLLAGADPGALADELAAAAGADVDAVRADVDRFLRELIDARLLRGG